MAKNLTSHRPGLAISLKLAAVFLFIVMAGMVKSTSDAVPPGQAVFFRSFFAIPIILAWLIARQELRQGLITRKPGYHVLRGMLGTMAMGLTFTGLGLLPLPEVTAIGFATPIFTVILAAILLGERIRMIRVSAVLQIKKKDQNKKKKKKNGERKIYQETEKIEQSRNKKREIRK